MTHVLITQFEDVALEQFNITVFGFVVDLMIQIPPEVFPLLQVAS